MSKSQLTSRVINKVSRESLRTYKEIRRLPRAGQAEAKTPLFVVGCQRSGTSLIMQIFEKDLETKVYYEFSKVSSRDDVKNLRLDPLPEVEARISKDTAPLVIMKPLVDSQNIVTILDYFDNGKALWMYRHFKDVAASNIKRWGDSNGLSDLLPIVNNEPNNWRSEGATEAVRETIKQYFAADMPPHDAAALFWYARNSLYFDLNLAEHPDVLICKYDDLALNPKEKVQEIYDFVGQPYPGDKVAEIVKAGSVGKGKKVELSPEIEDLCQGMLNKLDQAYEARA